MKDEPTYSLDEVKYWIRCREYRVTISSGKDAAKLGFDEADILECVERTTPAQFYKSMPAEKAPGLWQDVYWVPYCGIVIYLKLQLTEINKSKKKSIIVSFKEK